MAGYSSLKHSYIIVRGTSIPIKFKPDSIGESKSADYSQTTIYGRSAPLLGYTGSSARKVGLTIKFFVDGTNYKSFDEVDNYIKLLKSSIYPTYGGAQIIPPEPVILCIEKVLKIVGVVESIDVSVPEESAWNINVGKPYMREVRIEISEIRRVPLDWSEVKMEGGEPDG